MTGAPAVGVYVHWPYCARICPYCDFNVYKTRSVDAALWSDALVAELQYWAARTPRRALRSLYFGGGTPSLAPAETIAAVIDACERLFGFEQDAEITIEANPTDAERSRFAAFAGLGVNRLSLGVQSFEDDALAFLGRDHDGAAARRAIDAALDAFARMSFDLIYARPGQSLDGWRRELDLALSFGVKHLSLYQLTIESGTAFAQAVSRGAWSPPPEGLAADLFDLAQEATAAAGLPAYEISNHAAPGEASRHNMLYWTGQEYIGVGPGAHGRLAIDGARLATETILEPSAYLAAVARDGVGTARQEALDDSAVLTETLAMGLRLASGVALAPSAWSAIEARLPPLIEDGLLSRAGDRLVASPDGRRVLNALLAALLA